MRPLSETERRTLETAVDEGYFRTPRDATLETLTEVFDISKTGVSKNLRRAERKILKRAVSLFPSITEERRE